MREKNHVATTALGNCGEKKNNGLRAPRVSIDSFFSFDSARTFAEPSSRSTSYFAASF